MDNPIRARSWKRRIQTRIFLRLVSGFSYSAVFDRLNKFYKTIASKSVLAHH
jgi:hypothetical protein